MHDEPNRPTPLPEAEVRENIVLHMMLDDPTPGLWSTEELSKAVGRIETADALPALQAMGLIHRHGDFVWPTRAATRAAQIESVV